MIEGADDRVVRIRARGANGMGTNCTHQVAANNGPQATITYPS